MDRRNDYSGMRHRFDVAGLLLEIANKRGKIYPGMLAAGSVPRSAAGGDIRGNGGGPGAADGDDRGRHANPPAGRDDGPMVLLCPSAWNVHSAT